MRGRDLLRVATTAGDDLRHFKHLKNQHHAYRSAHDKKQKKKVGGKINPSLLYHILPELTQVPPPITPQLPLRTRLRTLPPPSHTHTHKKHPAIAEMLRSLDKPT